MYCEVFVNIANTTFYVSFFFIYDCRVRLAYHRVVLVNIHYMLAIGGGWRNDRWYRVDTLTGQFCCLATYWPMTV